MTKPKPIYSIGVGSVQFGRLTETGEITDRQDIPKADAYRFNLDEVEPEFVFTIGELPTITFTFEVDDRLYLWMWLMIWKRSKESLN